MAWLYMAEAIDALRQWLRALESLTPNTVEQVVTAWQQELRRQEHVPGELWKRWQCASCTNVVPQTYVVDHLSNPIKILCPLCWLDRLPDHEFALYFGEITARVYRR